MAMTAAQVAQFGATIKADILASQDLTGKPDTEISRLYNLLASPVVWVWRTSVSRAAIYTTQNDLPVSGAQTGFWEWATFKAQTTSEQNTWREMFMGDVLDISRLNNRNGIGNIFQGSAATTAQRDHCFAVGRRTCLRIEKLLAVGTGTPTTPATMAFEGTITPQNVSDILIGF